MVGRGRREAEVAATKNDSFNIEYTVRMSLSVVNPYSSNKGGCSQRGYLEHFCPNEGVPFCLALTK
jgi:hypothetical protein